MALFKKYAFIGLYMAGALGCTSKLHTAESAAATADSSGEFSIAILPDTQYYTEESQGGNIGYFKAQTDWIMKNKEKEHIAYVIQVGDIVDKGDLYPRQWENAWAAMSTLETPYAGHPYDMPYGMAVGNHDQSPSQFAVSGKTMNYNKYYGVSHFAGRPYYGGHYGNDNDSHYDLFSAGGVDMLVIYMEFDAFDEMQDKLNDWACSILDKYADRKAIIVSHYIIGFNKVPGVNNGGPASFGKQGERMYDRLKTRRNLCLMICGHVGDNGEGYRKDAYAGNTVKTFLSDYQSRPHGGNGLMRLMTFSKKNDQIRVRTLSPYLGIEEEDADSKFVKPWFKESGASRVFDFNNDSKSEPAVFSEAVWTVNGKAAGNFGKKGDIAVPADFSGTGQATLAVYDTVQAVFHIQGQPDIALGQPGDVPLPADYDGDGVADAAVWRPANATWYIKGREPLKHGWKDAIPVPADYDGDGRTEPAVWRRQNNTWYIAEVGNVPFGITGDIPVPGDYNGDGKAEMAVFRPSNGAWYVYGSKDSVLLGQPGDIPVPGDYLGEGKIHPAVYRPQTGALYLHNGQTLPVAATRETIVNLPYHIKRSVF
ncbi:metallophosphoesterase [Deminuibacter soli]|uniref:Calcineurin-like phosphoesterase domain-containing protein n=1 Tax=Deminuibacter soli TaxID=2291815 RepID=A0A3E1NF69_9BACT|nr:metallophosphoesterase [Deminuibacter soli]RFM26626.1 hypothetical protein DXN05_18820 [Deminuibacter soli]